MSRRAAIDRNAVLQPIKAAAAITGLSQKYLRTGCRTGQIPHLKIGGDYRICMPEFIAQIQKESRRAIYAEKESSLSS